MAADDVTEHEKWTRAVFEVCRIVAATPAMSDDDLVRALRERGHSATEAEKLCSFVPSAFGWAMFQRFGMNSFPSTYVLSDAKGHDVELPIAEEHAFTAALAVATSTLKNGWSADVSNAAFKAVSGRSAEMAVLNQALEAKFDLTKAKLRPLRVHTLTVDCPHGTEPKSEKKGDS